MHQLHQQDLALTARRNERPAIHMCCYIKLVVTHLCDEREMSCPYRQLYEIMNEHVTFYTGIWDLRATCNTANIVYASACADIRCKLLRRS